MKNNLVIAFMAMLSILTISVTSCKNDDDQNLDANITFSNVEIGLGNTRIAAVGGGFHVECDIVSDVKIKSIEVKLQQKDGKHSAYKLWEDSKYVGVLNTTFHEHMELPETLETGIYDVTVTVTNINGMSKSYKDRVSLLSVDPNAPVVNMTYPNATNKTGKAGSKITFKATITTKHPIKGIEVEFHGNKEFPIEVDDYNGKIGTFSFEKEITIPADCPAGEYHVHLIVTDTSEYTTMAELEGFQVTNN